MEHFEADYEVQTPFIFIFLSSFHVYFGRANYFYEVSNHYH